MHPLVQKQATINMKSGSQWLATDRQENWAKKEKKASQVAVTGSEMTRELMILVKDRQRVNE